MKTKKQKRKKSVKTIEHIAVKKGNTAYFNDFLQEYHGARWTQIKYSLYDADYTLEEVNDYRNRLLEEFFRICKRNNLTGII